MKKTLIIIGILIVVGAIAALLVYKYVYNKPHPDYVTAEPEAKVKAKRLYTDFSKNPEIANERYGGKIIQIEGNITRVDLVDSLVVLVYVYGDDEMFEEGIRVTMLPAFHQEARKLSKLRPVKVKGLCTGYNGSDVIIEKGSLVAVNETQQ